MYERCLLKNLKVQILNNVPLPLYEQPLINNNEDIKNIVNLNMINLNMIQHNNCNDITLHNENKEKSVDKRNVYVEDNKVTMNRNKCNLVEDNKQNKNNESNN